jgi:ABC-type lipoprotein export system ATPase subunit
MGRLSSPPVRAHRAPVQSGVHRIRSLGVVGGFLDGTTFEFADGLNCVIGARGTGKTTALELIRFALDALPSPDTDPAGRRRIESLVEENLTGGRVEMTLETKEGMTYTVTRSWGEAPIVLTEDGKATEITLKGGTLFRADIYSQNEVESIADRSVSQLNLLDAFEMERVNAANSRIAQLLHDLAGNAGAIQPLQAKIASLNEELSALPSLNDKLKTFAAAGGGNGDVINQAHTLKSLRDREKRAVEGIGQFLGEYGTHLEGFEGQIGSKVATLFCRDVGTGPNEQVMGQVKQAVLDCGRDVDAAINQARRRIERVAEDLVETDASLTVRHNDQEVAFRHLIEQHQAAQGQAAERSRLEKARNELLAKQRNRDELVTQLDALQTKRREMLRQLSTLRDQRFNVRHGVAEMITSALHDTVRVSVVQYGNPEAYQELLLEVLRNAKVKPGLVAPKLVQAFWPTRLVEVVRAGDAKTLMSEAQLNDEQARKVMEALAHSPVLFDLETVELADLPRIELNDNGEYKESKALSTGQKCTTILPILLLDSDRPLLIDQPEDNLDNRFVFECIVGSIHQVKAKRQLIFVTHNPNIPVLGDAERVLVLDSNGSSARLARCGGVDECKDDIVTLLEGGEEAFRQRLSRYAYK